MKTSAATVNCTPSQAVLAPCALTYRKYACSARPCAGLDLTHTRRFREEASLNNPG
jgi:hypothetical protein